MEVDEEQLSPDSLAVDDGLCACDVLLRYSGSAMAMHRVYSLTRMDEAVREAGLERTRRDIVPLWARCVEDVEPAVRATLAARLPAVVEYLWTAADGADNDDIRDHVWFLANTLLLDEDVDVQQTARQAVVAMCGPPAPEEFIDEVVLPRVRELVEDAQEEDNRMEGFLLLRELIYNYGKRIVRPSLLPFFEAALSDASFRVRKAAVELMGEICDHVSSNDLMSFIYPIFNELTDDKVWGVRKTCVQMSPFIANAVPSEDRHDIVASLFKRFVNDTSRWVRLSAYEALGPLIASFGCNQQQGAVPDVLVDAFLAMRTIDGELIECCAFNFPGVVVTLGQQGWPKLRSVYKTLCGDMQWKVRRTLACSIHEIAKAIGPAYSEEDLLPIYRMMVIDVTEVRTSALRNLTGFLRLVPPKHAGSFVSVFTLNLFSRSSSTIIELLIPQIAQLIEYVFSIDEVAETIAPICLSFVHSATAAQRDALVPVFVAVFAKFKDNPEAFVAFFNYVMELSIESDFQLRQFYLRLVPLLGSLVNEEQTNTILPSVGLRAWDKVSNVRITAAQTLHAIQANAESFACTNDLDAFVQKTAKVLAKDKHPEVRSIALKLLH